MKRNLVVVLTLLFVLSSCPAALAAPDINSTVPAGHWSYDAVKYLIKDGMVSNTIYKGEGTLTRFQMGLITAEARRRKEMMYREPVDPISAGLIKKLSTEYAEELKDYGVRIAQLEKNFNFKFNTDFTAQVGADSPPAFSPGMKGNVPSVKGNEQFYYRLRFFFGGDLNEKAHFYTRLSHSLNTFGQTASANTTSGAITYGNITYLDVANLYFNDVFGHGDMLRVGRQAARALGGAVIYRATSDDGFTYSTKLDKDTSFKVASLNIKPSPAAAGTLVGDSQDMQYVGLNRQLSPELTMGVAYANVNAATTASAYGYTDKGSHIKGVYAQYKLGPVWNLLAEYDSAELKNVGAAPGFSTPSSNQRAFAIQLTTGKKFTDCFIGQPQTFTNMAIKGDDAFTICYYRLGFGVVPPGHSAWGAFINYSTAYKINGVAAAAAGADNTQGWIISYQRVLDKNVVLELAYSDLKFTNGVTGPNGNLSAGGKFDRALSLILNTAF